MESTLSLKLSDLTGEVGAFLGFGRGADNGDTAWTASQQAEISSCVRSGLRQFYSPPPLDGSSVYEWSFLTPTADLTFRDGQSVVALPDDFGGFQGPITLSSADSQAWRELRLGNEGQVRQQYTVNPDATGAPLMAALQPLKGTQQREGQRWQLYLFPTADQDYTISFPYTLLPDYLSASRPYPLGGSAHAETILESCLAIAEQRIDDAMSVHSAKFMERLQASIMRDRQLKPQFLGYNGDRSDGRMLTRRETRWPGTVTFDGVAY